jgi:hypothetical protein
VVVANGKIEPVMEVKIRRNHRAGHQAGAACQEGRPPAQDQAR